MLGAMDYQAIARTIREEAERLEQQAASLRKGADALTGTTVTANHSNRVNTARKRTLSASARRRIAEAQKARWAKWHRTHKKAGA